MKRLLILIPIAIAAGCKVGPDYATPKLPIDASYGPAATSQPASMPTTQPLLGGAWWKQLGDPMLDSLVDRAIRSNLDVKIAAARVREARAYRAIIGAEDTPQVDATASATRNQLSRNAAPYNAFKSPGFPWTFNNYQTGFDAAWEMDTFGGAKRDLEAATADVQASMEMQRGVLLSITGEVSRNYVELRGAQQALIAVRENLRLQQETLDLTIERAQKGVSTDLDVARATAQVASTESFIPVLESQQWQAIYRLAVLLGCELDPLAAELTPQRDVPAAPNDLPLGVPADLLRRRPDIRRAERELAAATARVGSATADLYPRFALTGAFQLQSQESYRLARSDSFGWNIGPSMSWPIFDGGRLRAAVQVRSAQQEQALLRYEQTTRQAIEEVRSSAVSFSKIHDQRLALERAVKANRDAAGMSRQLYDKGLSDFTAVLDAQRALAQTQELLVRSRANESTSLIALCKGLGGGWDLPTPDDPTTRPTTN